MFLSGRFKITSAIPLLSILVKTTDNHNQIDLNINCKIKNTLWFGTSYRQEFGPTVYLGVDVGKLLAVYSHDISQGPIGANSDGTHEITLGYDFISDQEVIQESSDNGLVSDQDNNVYLVKIKNIYKNTLSENNQEIKKFVTQTNSKLRDNLYNSYDFLLNEKYEIDINQNTLDRMKNYFK